MQICDIDYTTRGRAYRHTLAPGGYVAQKAGTLFDVQISSQGADLIFVASNIVFYAVLGSLCGSVVGFLTAYRVNLKAFMASHCKTCHYNLTGNESGVCPECGTKA
ncbi:MAG: hypothetical protein IH989_05880 [Planctomycetes bacterium]|nr:hypothetical protein [Planctomycetota bacterium]